MPLFYAIQRNDIDCLNDLIKQGADPNSQDSDKETLLHLAAKSNQKHIIELLLKCGADIKIVDKYGRSPLFFACMYGHLEIVKLLFSQHKLLNIEMINDDGFTPLHFSSDSVQILDFLLTNGVDANAKNKYGETPLHFACKHNNPDAVKLLLANKAIINAMDDCDKTPLFNAYDSGHDEVVKLLIENGANCAIERAKDSIKDMVSFYGAFFDMTSHNGHFSNPLHVASARGHQNTVKLLLDRGVNVNQIDDNKTPLHSACYNGHYEVVNLLIDNGADIGIVDRDGSTPLHNACQSAKSPKVVKLLLESGADVNALDKNGKPPLDILFQFHSDYKGEEEIVKLLLDNGADINILVKYNCMGVLYALNSCVRYQLTYMNPILPQVLDLSKQNLTDSVLPEGGLVSSDYSISTILKSNTSIAKLNLAGNNISHSGMWALAEALKVNETLRILDLSNNTIGSRSVFSSGVQYIISSLKSNTGLVKLNLKGCSLDNADIKTLVSFLKNRKHSTLEQIDLDDDVVAALSVEDRKLLPKEKINEAMYLAPPKVQDQKNDNNTDSFLKIADKIKERFSRYSEKQWQNLEKRLSQEKPSVSELSIDDRKIWVAHEMLICLGEAKSRFLSQQDDLTERNIRYINALAKRFLECADMILIDHQPELTLWISDIQQIIDAARSNQVADLLTKYDEQYLLDPEEKNTFKIFHKSFENRMNALYNAASGIGSQYLKSEITTPIEKIGSAVKGIVKVIPHFGEMVGSAFHLLHLGGTVADITLKGLRRS